MMMSINQLMTSWDGYHTVSWSWKHMLKNVVVQSSICVHHYQDKDKVTAASLVASLQYMSPFSPTYLTFFYVPVHSRLSYLLSQHHSAVQYCTHYGHGWLWGGNILLRHLQNMVISRMYQLRQKLFSSQCWREVSAGFNLLFKWTTMDNGVSVHFTEWCSWDIKIRCMKLS